MNTERGTVTRQLIGSRIFQIAAAAALIAVSWSLYHVFRIENDSRRTSGIAVPPISSEEK